MVIPLATVVSFIFYFGTSKKEAPSYIGLLSLIGALSSIVWMYVLNSIAINILRSLADCMNISPVFLVSLILGLGHTVPVGLTKIITALLGYGDMGMMGCFASQTINLSIGIFVSFIRNSIALYFLY